MKNNQLELPSQLLGDDPYGLRFTEKSALLMEQLIALTLAHAGAGESYKNMIKALFPGWRDARSLEDIPWLPVSLFKLHELKSVVNEAVVKTLVSSGTSGQPVSKIFLDKQTSSLMSRALVKISSSFLGKKRLPMLIIDEGSFVRDRSKFNARAAGILGFSNLGRDHFYALDEDLQPDWDAVSEFVLKHREQPIFLFGFTFIAWQQFLQEARDRGISIQFPPGSMLIHGGGWKKLTDLAVSNSDFKQAFKEVFGIDNVYNYYGMVEQVGSIYFECENGFLHTPSYSDVIIRNPATFKPVPVGEEGLIQVLSVLPRSYPGHSLLTEDIGTICGVDDCECGRLGKRFLVHGRLPNVEMRGCSDTRAIPQ